VLVEALGLRRAEIAGYVAAAKESAIGVMAGMAYLGGDEELLERGSEGIVLVNGVGTVDVNSPRRSIFEKYRKAGFTFAAVIHPAAMVASDVVVGDGAQIMAGAVLQPGTRVGANAIVNTGALIDHDGIIGDHAHISPGACLAGSVVVGSGAHVGAGATVIQNIRIGEGSVVAAGAVVVDDVAARTTVKGVPARITS
jgi:sugar O-acyltransferase (sialic acid O-acetyltransferase NeuD family)